MKSSSFLEVESVSQSTLIIINDKVCSLSTQTATRLILAFFPTWRERWEITENIMEQFLWLSMKAVYLWRLLNSQAGFFTWLLFERTGGIPLTTQVCLWYLTQGNERKLTSEAIWSYVYWYIKMNPFFSNFQLQTGALQTQALFFHTYFNKKQATANWAQDEQGVALPGTHPCAPRYKVWPKFRWWHGTTPKWLWRDSHIPALHLLLVHKGCTAFSKN